MKALVAIIFLTLSSWVSADFITLKEFKSRGGIQDANNVAYLAGLAAGIAVVNGFSSNNGNPVFCHPPLLALDASSLWALMSDVAMEFPALLDEGIPYVATAAVQRAFPCQ